MRNTLPPPRAVIFDWDDTLVDTWPVVRRAINHTLVAMGQAPWSEEEARAKIGPPAAVLFTELFGPEQWRVADQIYMTAYQQSIRGHLKPHTGAEVVLQYLQNQGLYIAVVSAKRGPLLREEAKLLGFDRYIRRFVGAGDAIKDKPDRAAVDLALQESAICAGPDVWFIGDSQTDIVCAEAAGCRPFLMGDRSKILKDGKENEIPVFRIQNCEDLYRFMLRKE